MNMYKQNLTFPPHTLGLNAVLNGILTSVTEVQSKQVEEGKGPETNRRGKTVILGVCSGAEGRRALIVTICV